MSDYADANGLILVALSIRDEECRERIIHRLCNIGEQITRAIYEVNTATWDDGLWEQEVAFFERQLEGTGGRMLVWRFQNGNYARFEISDNI